MTEQEAFEYYKAAVLELDRAKIDLANAKEHLKDRLTQVRRWERELADTRGMRRWWWQ